MKLGKKLMAVLLVVLMVITMTGCGDKLEKLQNDAQQLLDNGDYAGAVDLYEKGLNDGLDHDTIITKLQEIYTDWAQAKSNEADATIADVLRIMEELGERFPDAKEYSENTLSTYCMYYLITVNGTDIDKITNFYRAVKTRYTDSTKICDDIDEMYVVYVQKIVKDTFDNMLTGGLRDHFENQDFEEILTVIENSGIEDQVNKARYIIELPLFTDINGKKRSVNWEEGCFTMYYGEVDSYLNRSGSGVHYAHLVDGSNYAKEITYGQFSDDKLNGRFKQYLKKQTSRTDISIAEGSMTDNKFDGVIKSTLERDGEKYKCTFTFNEGKVVVIDSEEKDGTVSYYVAEVDAPKGKRYYTYRESFVNKLHGALPWCNSLY